MKNILFILGFALTTTILTGCFPNTSRMNAKLEDGLHASFFVGGSFAPERASDSTGSVFDSPYKSLDLQLDLGYSKNDWDFQLKIPMLYVFSSLDIYYLFYKTNRRFLGAGVELGLFPATYLVITEYLAEDIFLTLTPRVIVATSSVDVGGEASEDLSRVWLNPQLAFGYDFDKEKTIVNQIAVYLSYIHVLGEGYDYGLGIGHDSSGTFFRKHFLETGFHVGF